MLKCKICKNYYSHLGSHIWHKHRILAIDYKEKFGLDHKKALITKEIKVKKIRKFWENPVGLKNLKEGRKYQFKKGRTFKAGYISAQQKRRIWERLVRMNTNKREKCPVCKMIFAKLSSHLYNKHKLLRVK